MGVIHWPPWSRPSKNYSKLWSLASDMTVLSWAALDWVVSLALGGHSHFIPRIIIGLTWQERSATCSRSLNLRCGYMGWQLVLRGVNSCSRKDLPRRGRRKGSRLHRCYSKWTNKMPSCQWYLEVWWSNSLRSQRSHTFPCPSVSTWSNSDKSDCFKFVEILKFWTHPRSFKSNGQVLVAVWGFLVFNALCDRSSIKKIS